jgi:hypothetical protein
MECYPALAEIVPEKCDNDGENLSEKVVDGADLNGKIEDAEGQGQTAHGHKYKAEELAEIIPACILKIEVFVQEKINNHPAGVRDGRRVYIPDTKVFCKNIEETDIDQGGKTSYEKKPGNFLPVENG